MATFEEYPVGSKVRIKDPGAKPDNWNSDMMNLIGVTTTIRRIKSHNSLSINRNRYLYFMEDWTWTWRHTDLELLKLARPEPNMSFRMKKHGPL